MKRLFLCTSLGLFAVLLAVVLLRGTLPGAQATTVLFSDDFESGAGKWTVQSGGTWTVTTDGGTSVYSYTFTGSPSTARSIITETTVPGSMSWTDYVVQARVKVVTGTGGYYAMLLARYTDSRNYYFMTLRGDNGKVEVRRYYNGSSSGRTLGSSLTDTVSLGTWYTAALELNGNSLRAFINGTPVVTATDTSAEAFFTGTVGVATATASAMFDDVVVTLVPATLSVTKSGTGSGTVSSVPAGIDCGMTCTADFDKGTVVTLTATPATGSSFGSWGGACLGPGTVILPGTGLLPQCVVPMTAAMDVTATFSTYNIFLPIVFK